MALDTGIHAGMTTLGQTCVNDERSAWKCRQRRSTSRTARAVQDLFPRWSVGKMQTLHLAT